MSRVSAEGVVLSAEGVVLSVCFVVRRADEEKERKKGEEPSIYHFRLFGVVSVNLMHHRIKVDYIGGHGTMVRASKQICNPGNHLIQRPSPTSLQSSSS